MERYPAPPSKPDPGTAEWVFDWVAETAGPLAAWVAGQATSEPAITALFGVVAALALWRLAWAIIKTPRQSSAPSAITGAPRSTTTSTTTDHPESTRPPFLTREATKKPTFVIGSPIPPCRWKQDKRRHRRTRFTRWMCAECGAEGYSANDSPPTECKRALRAHQL